MAGEPAGQMDGEPHAGRHLHPQGRPAADRACTPPPRCTPGARTTSGPAVPRCSPPPGSRRLAEPCTVPFTAVGAVLVPARRGHQRRSVPGAGEILSLLLMMRAHPVRPATVPLRAAVDRDRARAVDSRRGQSLAFPATSTWPAVGWSLSWDGWHLIKDPAAPCQACHPALSGRCFSGVAVHQAGWWFWENCRSCGFFWEWLMTLGLAPRQADLFRSTAAFCEGRVAPGTARRPILAARAAPPAHAYLGTTRFRRSGPGSSRTRR
jgi:hypothetical protein